MQRFEPTTMLYLSVQMHLVSHVDSFAVAAVQVPDQV